MKASGSYMSAYFLFCLVETLKINLISNDTMLSVVAAAYEELLYEVNSWLYCYLIGRKRFLIES